MNIIQLIGIGIIGAIATVILKSYKPEYAFVTVIATSCTLMYYVVTGMGSIITSINNMIAFSGINKEYFSVIIKIIGISYITEIASEICKDAGQNAIAIKLEMVGKIFILVMSMPIIQGFMEVCTDVISKLEF